MAGHVPGELGARAGRQGSLCTSHCSGLVAPIVNMVRTHPHFVPQGAEAFPRLVLLLVLLPLQGTFILRLFHPPHRGLSALVVRWDNLLILNNADGWAPPGRSDVTFWDMACSSGLFCSAKIEISPPQPTSHNLSPCAKGHVCAQNIRFTIFK